MDKKQGKLIVIEGIDGSGKTTQVNLLADYLKSRKITHEVISFPRYEDNIYGRLIRRYLNGEFGGIEKVDSYLLSLAYAGDRSLAKPVIEHWLSEGKIVIANRYVASNKAHMGANLPDGQREEFMRWLDELEYKANSIPKESLTILLSISPEITQKNVTNKHHDIHEQDLNHLRKAFDIYLKLSESENNWYAVNCLEKKQMKSAQDIHQEVVKIFEQMCNGRHKNV